MIRFSPSLQIGQAAPSFSLPDSKGKIQCLEDFSGKWLVLFFYPADFTSGCTVESCLFRDRYQEFRDLGAELVGVSGDPGKVHEAFIYEYQLPYTLLSDSRGLMRRAYTVPQIFGRLSGHVIRSLEFLKHASQLKA
jgi:peroxiredoxin Q/BCP